MNTELALAMGGKNSHSIIDAMPHMAGMLMVLVTLAILWWVCVITAKVVAFAAPTSSGAAAAPKSGGAPARPLPDVSHSVAAGGAPSAPESAGTPPEIVAVIAAAVATVSAGPVRVVSIRRIDSSWERAGRKSVLTSHRIR